MKLRYPKTSFYGGLLNPAAEGKIENALLNAALRRADNCCLDKNGNIASADGTKLTAELNTLTGQSGPFAKVEFKVSEILNYVLIFADEKIYIKQNGIYLQDENNHLITIDSPYKAEELFDENGILKLKYVQSADVLYIAHPNHNLYKIMRKSNLVWEIAQVDIKNGPWGKFNENKNLLLKASDTTGIVDLYARTGDNPVINNWGPILGGGGWTSLVLRIYIGGFDGEGTMIYELAGTSSSLPAGSIAEMAAAGLNSLPQFMATNPTRNTVSIEVVSNQSSYSGEKICIHLHGYYIVGGQIMSEWVQPYNGTFSTIDTSNEIFSQNDVGRFLRIFESPDYVITAWRTGLDNIVADTTICTYGNNQYIAKSGGTTGTLPPVHTEGKRSDGGVVWQYLNSGYGYGEVTEYIDTTHIKLKVWSESLPTGVKTTNGSYLFQWSLHNIKPSCLEFYKDRLFLGLNDISSGPIIVASNTGDYENFDDIEYGEQLATSGINFTPQGSLNEIYWLKNVNDILYMGTSGNVIAIQPLNSGEVLGPNNITYKPIAFIPCSKIPPLVLDTILMFTDISRKKIYSLQYNYNLQSFVPQELTANNDFFLKDTIVSWALSYTPDKTVYAVSGSGEVLALKLLSQEFLSLVKFKTDKRFKQVISLFDGNLNKDLAEFVCLCGQNYLDETQGDSPLELALNCTLNFTGGVVSGAQVPAFLRGKNLFLIVNGQDYGPFNNAGEVIGLSGLGITADSTNYTAELGVFNKNIIEFMPVCGAAQSAKIAGATGQKITAVIARVWQSRQFKFGLNLRELWPAVKLSTQEPFNGDIVLDAGGSTTYPFADENGPVNSTGARFFIVQDRPAEFTVCGLFYDISVSES